MFWSGATIQAEQAQAICCLAECPACIVAVEEADAELNVVTHLGLDSQVIEENLTAQLAATLSNSELGGVVLANVCSLECIH